MSKLRIGWFLLVLGGLNLFHPDVHAQTSARIKEALETGSRAGGEGRHAEAEAAFRRVIGAESSGEVDRKDLAEALIRLAWSVMNQGRLAEAETFAKRAVAIREEESGPLDPRIAEMLITLTGIEQGLGRPEQAEVLFRRSIAIWESTSGAEHPDVARGLIGLAVNLMIQAKYSEAEATFKRTMTIWKKAWIEDALLWGPALRDRGWAVFRQGRPAEAILLLNRAAESLDGAYPGHPMIAEILDRLAEVHLASGAPEKARGVLKRALALLDATLPADHPQVGAVLAHLVDALQVLGK